MGAPYANSRAHAVPQHQDGDQAHLVKEWNIGWEDEYARLDALADPTFIEPKGYVFVGDSRRRMRMANMPSHAEIREFSAKLGERVGMNILKERKDSRVLVLGENESRLKIPGIED